MKKARATRWLFYFVFAVMFLPMTEQNLPFVKSGKLKGGFREACDSPFSIFNWMGGTFREQNEKHLNDVMGFRADIVRVNNQIDFSLFDICHAGWTVKGKDNYLFQYPYINAYYGSDFIGYATILENSIKLKAIQDTLSHLGKSLILVYAASKASSYPEYFPDDRRQRQGPTNYGTYRHVCDSLGVNQVDMDAWFVAMKGKSKEPIFSKQGIHWTTYGAVLAGDSLLRYMEQLTHIPVRHPDWSQMEHTDKLRGGDDDIAQELNLIFPVVKETLAYPVIRDVPDSGRKINAIYIGDSYCHKMVEFGIVYKMNGQCEFWRYFDEMHDINGHKFTYIKDYNWTAAIDRSDCVVLVYTLFNLTDLGNGFISKAYDHYFPKAGK